MESLTTPAFRKKYSQLPLSVQHLTKKTYCLWKNNPHHPSLHFKQIHHTQLIFSVRISLDWRALAMKNNNIMLWFWIGTHSEYDNLIAKF